MDVYLFIFILYHHNKKEFCMKRKSMVLAVALLVAGLGAVWAQDGGTVAQGNSIADKMEWLKAFVQTGGNYIVEVRADESIAPQELKYSGKNNITITIRGVGANRTLSLSSNGSMCLLLLQALP
jgi:hypothetical protein